MKHHLSVGIFVGGNFIPSYDGATNRMRYLSRHLQRTGIKVTIFHGYRGWTDLRLISREPFKTYIFPIDCYYNNLNFLADLIKKEKINIIQFNDLELIISQGVKLSQATGAYIVSESHYVVSRLAKSLGATPERVRSISKFEKIIGKIVDHVICLSKDDKPELQSRMHLPSDRISVVPSGVDLEEIVYHKPNFRTKTILFLGNLYFEPNADAVRQIYKHIFPKLKQRGFKFILVGDCPPGLKKQYQAQNFIFIGPIPNLNAVFRKTTVALAPVRESTGLRIKILNYLAAGLPVIATSAAVAGMPNTKNVIIEDNLKKYSNIILGLFNHPQRALLLSKEGRKFIEQKLDWRLVARKIISVYKFVLSRPVKNKLRFINLTTGLRIGQPAWLEEAERKGRFEKLKSSIHDKFSFGIINRGKINIIR